MPTNGAIQLNKSLWLQPAQSQKDNRLVAGYARSLRELGVRSESFQGDNQAEVERITRILRNSDDHLILFYIASQYLRKLRHVLEARGNYTLIADDWWSLPHWCLRHADFVLFRSFNAFAVRLGWAPFARFSECALLSAPENMVWPFFLGMSALRLGSLIFCPAIQIMKAWQRQLERIPLERMIYFPYAIREEDVSVKQRFKLEYDFSNVSNTYGAWVMRDPFAPAWFSGAALYRDRKRIVDAVLTCGNGHPYRVFNWDGRNNTFNYDEMCRVIRQSRFTVATGGIHQNLVPKYIEFACHGTPMIGRFLPYEYPWLDQCLVPVDPWTVNKNNILPQLEQAMAQYERLRDNCARLRDRLLEMYRFENCLRMAQAQINGKPIPTGYLKVDFRSGMDNSASHSAQTTAGANTLLP